MKDYLVIQRKSITILLMLVIFILNGCGLDDEGSFPLASKNIQNEGYLPLAPNNYWLWEARLADYNPDGSYSYDGEDFLEVEKEIVRINTLGIDTAGNGDYIPRLDYEFSPIVSTPLAGVLGNLSQVTKNPKTGEYTKLKITRLDVQRGGEQANRSFTLVLKDKPFLGDSLQVGDIIDETIDTIEAQAGVGIKMVYKYGTYVTGKYEQIPGHLAQTPGIDTHLGGYRDILKTTDSITLVSLEANVNSVSLSVGLDIDVPAGSSSANINLQTQAAIQGWLFALPLPIPLYSLSLGRSITISGLNQQLTVCPAKAKVNINEMLDIPLKIASNQTPLYIDTYYAKNIGVIKTVSNIKEIKGKIIVELNKPYTVPIDILPTDPNCRNVTNTLELHLNLNAILNNAKVEIPLNFGTKGKAVIQNLRGYTIRETLNN